MIFSLNFSRKSLMLLASAFFVFAGGVGNVATAASPVSPAQAATKTSAVLISSVVKLFVNTDLPDHKTGTGFWVDPTGCMLTAAHVVVNPDFNKPYEKIEVAVPRDIRHKPEIIGNGQVAFFDQAVDMAVVCIQTPEFFPELNIADADQVKALDFGDDLKIVGFPTAGSDSPTLSPRTIIGFWDDPDLKQIGGAEKVDASRIHIIKTNGISGSGGSGGPILKNDQVVAMMFAGHQFSPTPGFSITSDSFRDWRDRMMAASAPSAGCIFDPAFNYFVKDGQKFYDNKCVTPADPAVEIVVRANYQARCPAKLEEGKIKKIAEHIKTGSSLENWNKYLNKICPEALKPAPALKAVSAPKIKSKLKKPLDFQRKI